MKSEELLKVASILRRVAAGGSIGGLAGTVMPDEEPRTGQGIMLGALLGLALPPTEQEKVRKALRQRKTKNLMTRAGNIFRV